jgi:hypothetical protein
MNELPQQPIIPSDSPQSDSPVPRQEDVSPIVPVVTTPPPIEKELTMKQRKWLDIYLQTGNATEAAMQSYDCKDRDSAKSIGCENLTKLDYIDFMEAAGVTDKLLQEKLLEGLDSTKQIGARKIVQGARTGHEIKVDAMTDTDDFIDVPDYAVRHKYLETALKLKKRLVEKNDVNMDVKISNITITREPMKDGNNS